MLKDVEHLRPYELVYVQNMQWNLVATEEIPEGSLLCEYKGEIREFTGEEDETHEYFILNHDYHGEEWGLFSTEKANEARYIAGIPENAKSKVNC
jgi:hypothetical protein